MAQAKPSFIQKYQDDNPNIVSTDKLQEIRQKAAALRDLRLQKEQLEADVAATGKAILDLQQRELPELMLEVGIDNLGLEAEGNYPAYDLALKPYYHANIGVDNPDADQAYNWLIKHGHGDLIKHQFIITFTRGEEKQAAAFAALLKKNKVTFDRIMGVPWNTLTAFVREQTEKGVALPLKLFNATVGRIADLKVRTEKRTAKKPVRSMPQSY